VNRLCLAAGVPLVESGTAGFLGQVGSSCSDPTGVPICGLARLLLPRGQRWGLLLHYVADCLLAAATHRYLSLQVSVHIKGTTECFECQPKPTPKTFPVRAGWVTRPAHLLSNAHAWVSEACHKLDVPPTNLPY